MNSMRGNNKGIQQLKEYSDDAKIWFTGKGRSFMDLLGLKSGFKVLDFGCRIGHYVIPAAEVIAPQGKVFALDQDHNSLQTF